MKSLIINSFYNYLLIRKVTNNSNPLKKDGTCKIKQAQISIEPVSLKSNYTKNRCEARNYTSPGGIHI